MPGGILSTSIIIHTPMYMWSNYTLPSARSFDSHRKIISQAAAKFPCYPKFDGPTMNQVATVYVFVAAVGLFFLVVLVAYLIVRFHEGIFPSQLNRKKRKEKREE